MNEPVSRIEYCLDGQGNIAVDGNMTLTGLSDGKHNVTVYATDVDGHIGISETAYFEIESFPTTLITASVITLAAVGIGLVYFKKRKR